MRDNRFGIVVSARDAWADDQELRALGAGCVRTVVHDFDDLETVLANHPSDVRVIALLDTRHPGVGRELRDIARWEQTVQELGRRFAGRIWALECLSSWDVLDSEAETVVAYTRRAARILQEQNAGITCVLGAVAGPRWISRFRELAGLLSPSDYDLLGGAAFHPYRKNARGFPGYDHQRIEHGEIDIAVQDAHMLIQMPIWVTEFGMRLGQVGGEIGQARYVRDAMNLLGMLPRSVLAAATYNCWSDLAGGPHQRGDHAFGLRREDLFDPDLHLTPREAWRAFADATGGTGRPPQVTPPLWQPHGDRHACAWI
jgi:hypothetical protein